MKNFSKTLKVPFKGKHSIVFLLVALTFYLMILFTIKNISTNKYNTYVTVFITIDSLITTSTISFVAFTNYASTASGSVQVNRKFSWGTIIFNSIEENGTWNKIKSYFFPETVTLVTASIFITFLDIFILMLSPKIIILLFLILNVTFSTLILVMLVIKYVVYNRNSYHYTANAIIRSIIQKSKPKKDSVFKMKTKSRIFAENHLNPLKNSKNDSLIRELARQFKKMESWKMDNEIISFFRNKIIFQIIFSPTRDLHSTMSLYISYKYSGERAGINDKKFIEDITMSCPWFEEKIYELVEQKPSKKTKLSTSTKKVKSSILNSLMILKIAHNNHHNKEK